MESLRILLVEDKPEDVEDLTSLMENAGPRGLTGEPWSGLEIEVAGSQEEADGVMDRQHHIVILDLRYPDKHGGPVSESEFQGMKWLPKLREIQRDAAIVILTNYPDIQTATQAVRDHNADDFMAKTEPFLQIAARIQAAWRHAREIKWAREVMRGEYWGMLRSLATRVHLEDVARLIKGHRSALAELADEIESGERGALERAPGWIRASYERLWRDFEEATDWIHAGNGKPDQVDLVEQVIKRMRVLYGGQVDISQVCLASAAVRTHGSDVKIAVHEVVRNALESNDAPEVRVSLEQKVEGFLIGVKDNGPGLRPEALNHLFQPGFTTKGVGERHQGMGLYIARRLLRAVGGEVEVRNAEGGGVQAWLTIPHLGAA